MRTVGDKARDSRGLVRRKFHAANPQENQDEAVSDGLPPHGFYPFRLAQAHRVSWLQLLLGAAAVACTTEPILPSEAAAMDMAAVRRKLRRSCLISSYMSESSYFVVTFRVIKEHDCAYDFFPIIALAARAVIIPYGRFTSSR